MSPFNKVMQERHLHSFTLLLNLRTTPVYHRDTRASSTCNFKSVSFTWRTIREDIRPEVCKSLCIMSPATRLT